MAIQFNPVGGQYNGVKPLKQDTTLSALFSMESVLRYDPKDVIGKFYPIKYLPAKYIDSQSQMPVVMSAGTIVSVVPAGKPALLSGISAAPTGIDANGNMYVTIGVDGNRYQKSYTYLYDAETTGLIFPCNGTGSIVSHAYSSIDVDGGVLTSDGKIPSASDTFKVSPSTPLGIVIGRVFGDIRERYQNYSPVSPAVGVCIKGYLTIPFISICADTSNTNTANAVNAFLAEANKYHQYLYVILSNTTASGDELDSFAPGAITAVDGSGKFTIDPSSLNFGKIVSLRPQPTRDLDEVVDTFPGSEIHGTASGGLSTRMYNFAATALRMLTDVSATPVNVNSRFMTAVNMKSGLTGRIVYGLVDIVFGY